LEKQGVYCVTFCEITQHNPIDCTRKGLQLLLEKGCDGIVTIGGGSCIEAGKSMIWFRMLHDREHARDQNGHISDGTDHANGTADAIEAKNIRPIPQIAIPTTLSAAEYHVRQQITFP
jgi:alcohol dehydrogenase class IV